jgi:3-hydroxybutyryl-CoA dehydrogenase
MNSLSKHVIIDSVEYTLPETNSFFVRINAWPTFLKSNLVEAAALSGSSRKITEDVFLMFNKEIEWVQDEIGFVTPKIVSMIINEAFFALEEEVSTKDQIDIAMKLGTNYPYGPFEWGERIGLRRITSLLTRLCSENLRYQPCKLLLQQNAV